MINENSANIMEYINLWNKLEDKSPLFARIFNTYWNTPEGSHSILMEFSDIINLQDIVNIVGSIPEL